MIHRVIGIVVLLVSLAAGGLWMDFQQSMDTPLQVTGSGTIVSIEKGASLKRLTRQWADSGLLDNAHYLYWYARLNGEARRVRAGEFEVPAGTTPMGLLDILVKGQTVSYALTLLEGWNFKQIREAIARDPVLEQTLTGFDDAAVMEKIGAAGQHPEGRFFPDTYLFPRGTTDRDFLQRAHRRMQQELKDAWSNRDEGLPIKTPDEALILASIVEKETGVVSERRQIAGVFTRRLHKGMKLQTDPTVIYGMGDRYDGNIRRADLREDTPYNTYVHHGLPPTPICMPGRAALDAAVKPLPGKSLYFVATGDGAHKFSATLKEHNAAVRKYQLKQ